MDPAVQTYIDAIPETHRPLFDRLHALILELYPNARVVISYRIPTYYVGRRRVYLGLWKEGYLSTRSAGTSSRISSSGIPPSRRVREV